MIAQVPELFETLTGMKVSALMGRLQQIDPAAVSPAAPVTNGVTRDALEIPVVRSGDGETG